MGRKEFEVRRIDRNEQISDRVRVELRQEEEVLASRETPPESSLLEMVRELISEGEDRGPILTQEEQSRIEL